MSIGSFFGNIGGSIRNAAITYGPQISVGLGVVGFIGTCIMVAKKTPDALEIIEETDETVKSIKADIKDIEEGRFGPNDEGRLDWLHREITHSYLRCAGGVAKAYLPCVIMGLASTGLVVGGHAAIVRRCSGLALAVNNLTDSFKGYRNRVRDEIGEEAEDRIYRGYHEETHEVLDTETGEVVEKTAYVPARSPKEGGPYSFVFNKETSTSAEGIPAIDLARLTQAEEYWNKVLRREIGFKHHGHVFLYDVLDNLDMINDNDINKLTNEEVREYRNIGWMRENRMNPESKQYEIVTGEGNTGDGYISFGIRQDPFDPATFYLDFNCDGYILNDITRWKS